MNWANIRLTAATTTIAAAGLLVGAGNAFGALTQAQKDCICEAVRDHLQPTKDSTGATHMVKCPDLDAFMTAIEACDIPPGTSESFVCDIEGLPANFKIKIDMGTVGGDASANDGSADLNIAIGGDADTGSTAPGGDADAGGGETGSPAGDGAAVAIGGTGGGGASAGGAGGTAVAKAKDGSDTAARGGDGGDGTGSGGDAGSATAKGTDAAGQSNADQKACADGGTGGDPTDDETEDGLPGGNGGTGTASTVPYGPVGPAPAGQGGDGKHGTGSHAESASPSASSTPGQTVDNNPDPGNPE